MPYVPAKTWQQMNTNVSALEKKVKEMEGKKASVGAMGYEDITQVIPGFEMDNETIDCGKVFSEWAKKNVQKEGWCNLYLPPGVVHHKTPFAIENKTISLKGSGMRKTIFLSGGGSSVFYIARPELTGMNVGCIENIGLQMVGKVKEHGSAIVLYQRYQLRNIDVRGYWKGLDVYGSIPDINSDASFSTVDNVYIGGCASDGLSIVGPDANSCSFTNIDIRDCAGIACNDESLLGNHFENVMTHNNKAGSFNLKFKSAKSNYVGCYVEDGDPRPFFHGRRYDDISARFSIDFAKVEIQQ